MNFGDAKLRIDFGDEVLNKISCIFRMMKVSKRLIILPESKGGTEPAK